MGESIDLHRIDDDSTVATQCENLLDRIERRGQKIVERKKFQFLCSYYDETVQFLRYNNMAGCVSGADEARYLTAAVRYAATYVSHAARTGSVTVNIDGSAVDLEITDFVAGNMELNDASYLALCADDDTAIGALLEFDRSPLFRSTSVGHRYLRSYGDLFDHVLAHGEIDDALDTDLAEIANESEEILPETKADYSHLVYLHQPLVAVLHALARGDATACNDHLAEALRRHQTYWTSTHVIEAGATPPRRDSHGWISYAIIGLKKLAQRRGVAIDVSSGYRPERLLSLTAQAG